MVYNIKGQRVQSFPLFTAGTHEISWNGKDKNGKETNSGIYFIKMLSDTNNQIKKIIKLK